MYAACLYLITSITFKLLQMKTFVLFACGIFLAIACNNPGGKTESTAADNTTDAAPTVQELDYPYTLDKPYKDWQPGDQKNAVMVMKMLKAWESKNVAECVSYFADSTEMHFDYFHKVVQRDSMPKFIEQSWADYASVKIKMQDWISVVARDGSEEWVTLWYKQSWADKKGKADSMNMVNDAKIVNGKIALFDEKVQHFGEPKR